VWDRENSSMIYSVRKINSIYALATTEKHNGNNLKYVIMQSAGVQDSNRKMIYEGDILRAKNSTLKDLVVCYNISEGLLNMYSPQDNGWHKIDYKVCYKYTEIVGNIYEHREEWGKIIFNKP
jgi:uncharacterized phage protein (TIGR01671 family)